MKNQKQLSWVICAIILAGLVLFKPFSAAQNQAQSTSQKQQDIPDAPTPQAAPPEPPHRPATDDQRDNQPTPPVNDVPTKGATTPSSGTGPSGNGQDPNWPGPNEPEPGSTPGANEAPPGEKPPLNMKTVPEGGATAEKGGAQEELYKLSVNVNQVMLQVRVTDNSGRLVNGLLPKDFVVYEDGKKQTMNFFTSDPLAVSVAVIFDLGMPDVAVQKVNKTFSALQGAFSQYDEVALYTYSSTVGRPSGFGAVNRQLQAALNKLETERGHNNGPPVT